MDIATLCAVSDKRPFFSKQHICTRKQRGRGVKGGCVWGVGGGGGGHSSVELYPVWISLATFLLMTSK